MLFNSFAYAAFLPAVFFIYWFGFKKRQQQNVLLLVVSYFFYSCWDWRFLFLLMFSTGLDFYTGITIAKSKNLTTKKFWFWLSITINLGFLSIFKYYNFFAENLILLFSQINISLNMSSLQVILPVGISFYTFHGLSYVIDVYHGNIEAEKNLIDYGVFVSFFPLLVAGPIERATHLLPQLKNERKFSYSLAVDGMRQILWGLFKKVVIADNCATFANLIFNNPTDYSSSTLILGALFFSMQIYGDFSGYSDIALGSAKLLGIQLLQNFSFPYFSRNIAEFWRRWHISLSGWFRDYLYIPLGGSRVQKWKQIRNTFIIFIVSGFWHGANWTFIVWGFLHACYIMPSIIFQTNRKHTNTIAENTIFPTMLEVFSMIFTFTLVTFAWIFFRAENLTKAFEYIAGIFSLSIFSLPDFPDRMAGFKLLGVCFSFLVIEWLGRNQKYAIQSLLVNQMPTIRWIFYLFILCCLFAWGGKEQQFIYFQF